MACSVLLVAEKSAPFDSCVPISKLLFDEQPVIAKHAKTQQEINAMRFISFM
jgi:hypothetical protein